MENIQLKKNKNFWCFYIDEEKVLEISQEDYLFYRLYEKDFFTQTDLDSIINAVEYKRAKSIAQESNIYRNKSAKQIASKLEMKGFREEIVNSIVDEMLESKEINERDIIKRFINDRLKFKPRSKKLLKYELINKGFDCTEIEYIIEGLNLSDEDIAKDLIKKRKTSIMTPEAIIKYLKNKGFDYNTIKKLL